MCSFVHFTAVLQWQLRFIAANWELELGSYPSKKTQLQLPFSPRKLEKYRINVSTQQKLQVSSESYPLKCTFTTTIAKLQPIQASFILLLALFCQFSRYRAIPCMKAQGVYNMTVKGLFYGAAQILGYKC